MNEDYGNLDQLNFFAAYCFNAGATWFSFRPLGHQTNEVILDNDDAAVTFAGTWNNSSQTTFWGSPATCRTDGVCMAPCADRAVSDDDEPTFVSTA